MVEKAEEYSLPAAASLNTTKAPTADADGFLRRSRLAMISLSLVL
jgi:hypothetical protein